MQSVARRSVKTPFVVGSQPIQSMSVSDRLRRLRPRGEPTDRTEETDDRSRLEHAAYAGVRGLQAGFVATLIMTAFRLPIMRSLQAEQRNATA
ncbi:hypothetical protein AArc1_0127 [Natrarchaeobaculum sulfurireducens]|uniref:Uncharacterized protein n=1 Tax=Natrarchaeobaculum sulfurireducens TaxID=2044521 RepID=A0A346PAD5_9EURY|nr:hypothetical protein AArc1_0127 [Natrarchaeobaculum sulfurireducens]